MKKLIPVILAVMILVTMSGCNKQIIDTTHKFDRAILSLPDGTVISGKVDSWKDYDGDQIQVKIDGVTYLTFFSNVVLIND